MNLVGEIITVNAPIAECYKTWTSLELLPRFIRKVESVTMRNNQFYWHWRIRDPYGKLLAWDTVVEHQQPNAMLAWHSVDNSPVMMEGRVLFTQKVDSLSKIDLKIGIDIPEQISQEFAGQFFENPLHLAEEIMTNFKNLVEKRIPIP